jgi:Family of unknown function (DUF6526)
MANTVPQTYKTHRRFVPLFHFVIAPFLVFHLGWTLWILYKVRTFGSLVHALLALALIFIFLFARSFALKVQDRVIRLEMRLRLQEVLPGELRGRIDELSTGSLVALRFASTAELPDLVRRVLDGELKGREPIKKAIQHWQADDLRA